MKRIHYVFIAVAASILFLLVTNPTLKDFKEHIGISNTEAETKLYLQRCRNYFICSTYSIAQESGSYFAIAGNFFYIKDQKAISSQFVQSVYDQLNGTVQLDDFETFKKKLGDTSYRRAIYKEAKKVMAIGSYEKFESDVNSAIN